MPEVGLIFRDGIDKRKRGGNADAEIKTAGNKKRDNQSEQVENFYKVFRKALEE